MNNNDKSLEYIMYALGSIVVIWLALLVAPYITGGLIGIVENFAIAMENPFDIIWCEDSLRTILIFLLIYILAVGAYLSTRRNYRRQEEMALLNGETHQL